MKKRNGYEHFLTYDQWEVFCFFGNTDLYYQIDGGKLKILREFQGNAVEVKFERDKYPKGIKQALKCWLIDYLAQPSLFWCEPVYINSLIFSEEEFNSCKGKAAEMIRIRKENASRKLMTS